MNSFHFHAMHIRGQSKTAALFHVLFFLLIVWNHAVASNDKQINIYNWEGYLSQDVIEQFQRQSGYEVHQVYFDQELIRDETITSGRSRVFDLILMDDITLREMKTVGLFQDLSSLLGTIESFSKDAKKACGKYGIPYGWGTNGILHRSSVSKTPITSWRQLFVPPPEHQGRVVMHFDVYDTTASAMLALGEPPYSNNLRKLKEAQTLILNQEKYRLDTKYALSYAINHGQKSQMSLAFGFSSDLYFVREVTGQEDWEYVIPKEGTPVWYDCWAIPRAESIKQATREFLLYLYQPKVAAANAEEIWFATSLESALPHTSEDYRSDNLLFPEKNGNPIIRYPYIRDIENYRVRERMPYSWEYGIQ
ncbi:spermidine/putrescine ABC transporter substrate-binding protein [Pseudomaricurvus alkylphenolicus]|jgi:spermidine/putrescine-binding protein|uniref:polyamine ABC transporter substrate-binding protein n=1 Tax=Pseudomaricurvus alkylphenolicus TaxID=1306991 RepID=UPI00142470FF|nr:spermidine/putrescine ABC transporter substrate-binding protein [Pseudomaricurvus alkylphenolicus]NIB42626.1 spermidine/putrescine ABC transporter substrate-binding protein [Pseudomaricurvus alkylphenolicus]